MNVVSTSPSGTEICYALGVEPVAVSHACDYPPEVEDKPAINISRITDGASAERHQQVQASESQDHVYDVDVDRLRESAPDLIISQQVCGVCAVDTTLIETVLPELPSEPEVVGLSANRLEDVYSCIEQVGEVTGTEAEAQDLLRNLKSRLATIESQASQPGSVPRTLVIEWMDPIHLGANWVPELVEIAGGQYDLIEPGERSSEINWQSVIEYDPEVVVVAPCSYSVDRTRQRVDELSTRPGWETLSAVQTGRVYLMDGSSYLTRWTPRLIDAAERLAACIHPSTFGEPADDVLALHSGGNR